LQRIRIVLVDLKPQLLRDLTSALLGADPALEVTRELDSAAGLASELRKRGADIVLLGLPNGDFPPEYRELLDEFPRMTLLGIASEGRRGFLYRMEPNLVPIGELDPDRLLSVIKEAARTPG
jgi:DNA-binding NarL/FixJ family response regulator